MFWLAALAIPSYAETNIMFDKANQLYRNKMYDSAANLYMQMIDEGYCHADLFYNAGNAFYRNKDIGMAVWCYEKAIQHHNELHYRDNLALARKKITDPIPMQKPIFFVRWWQTMYHLLPLTGWALIALLSFLIFMINAFVRLWRNRVGVSWQWILISVTIFSLAMMSVLYYETQYHYTGVIIKKTYLRRNFDHHTPIEIAAGIEVTYEGKGKDGIIITLPNGIVGEIDPGSLKKL